MLHELVTMTTAFEHAGLDAAWSVGDLARGDVLGAAEHVVGGVVKGVEDFYLTKEKDSVESMFSVAGFSFGGSGQNTGMAFVKLREGLTLDAALEGRIKQQIRANTTPRHVPAKIVQVRDIPRTKSGKIVELAVRNVVHDLPVKNVEALANPEALEQFRDRPELKS